MKGKGWKGESRRHSLSRKGIKTNIDKTKRLSVRNFVARGNDRPNVKYLGEGRSMHGYLDRSWDEHLFEEDDGTNIEVFVFSEPDYDSLREVAEEDGIPEHDYDGYIKKEQDEFWKEGNGEIHVIWAGALDFNGTQREFIERYPELNKHLELTVPPRFKVWSGRYSKIVEADDHQDAIKKSGYKNADQVDKIG